MWTGRGHHRRETRFADGPPAVDVTDAAGCRHRVEVSAVTLAATPGPPAC